MSVVQLSQQNYVGLSTDSKPTVGTVAGSKFIEYDTDNIFVFDGAAWRQINNTPTIYVGLSTDSKPTDASVSQGSTFKETDTGSDFIYDGSTWQRVSGVTKTHVGFSTDVKPTDASVPEGAIFFEHDTAIQFHYDGTAWLRIPSINSRLPENQAYITLLDGATRNMNVNGSATPVVYKAIVPVGKEIEFRRMNVLVQDGSMDLSDFGAIGGDLGTGVDVKAFDTDDAVLKDYCAGFPVKTNGEWGLLAGVDSKIQTSPGAGDDTNNVRFTWTKGSGLVRLMAGQYIGLVINDDLTSITKFFAMAQGEIFDA